MINLKLLKKNIKHEGNQSVGLRSDTYMVTLLTHTRNFQVVLTFKSKCRNFMVFTTTLMMLILKFSTQWIERNFVFLDEKNTVGIKQWLDKHYGDSALLTGLLMLVAQNKQIFRKHKKP